MKEKEALSGREKALLQMLADGDTMVDINKKVGETNKAIYNRMHAIRLKLEAKTNIQAVVIALKERFIKMNKSKKTYDPRCLELAKIFIIEYEHTHGDLDVLAWAIQDAIDNYINGLEPKEKK